MTPAEGARGTALPKAQVLSADATRPRRHRSVQRYGLIGLLLAAAMPVRLPVSLGIIHSVSVLDIVLLGAAATLYVRAVSRRLDVGYPKLFLLLGLAPAASLISLSWSLDPAATARSTLIYLEGVIAYLYVVNETAGLRPDQVVMYMEWWVYLLIVPGVLLLLHVPGFSPQAVDLSPTSAEYLSYFTRLSHPILGRSNNLATVLAFFVPPLLYLGLRRHVLRFTIAGLIGLIAVALTFSRGVLLALILAGVLYWLASVGRRGRLPRLRGTLVRKVGAVTLTLVAAAGFYQFNPATNQFLSTRLSGVNVTERIDLVSAGIASVAQNPLLGYGGGVTPQASLALGVHNTYLQQVIYYGIPLGLLICTSLLLICKFFFSASPALEVGRVLGFAILVQLFVFVFESSFEGTVLKVLFYLSIGLAVGVLRAAQHEARSPGGAPARSPCAPPARLPLGRSSQPCRDRDL